MKLYIINWQSGEPLVASEVEYPDSTAEQIIEAWKDNPQPVYATAKWVQANVAELEEPKPAPKQVQKEEVKEEPPKEDEKPKRKRRGRKPAKPKSVEDIENQKAEDEQS